MSAAMAVASSALIAVPNAGAGSPARTSTSPNSRRSSARSIADGLVPALQKRGLARRAYAHAQFRDNLLEFKGSVPKLQRRIPRITVAPRSVNVTITGNTVFSVPKPQPGWNVAGNTLTR
jgi:hypothetical protein